MITGGILLILLVLIILFRANILNKINIKGLVANLIYFIVMIGLSIPTSMLLYKAYASLEIQNVVHEPKKEEIQKAVVPYLKEQGYKGSIKINISWSRHIVKNKEFALSMNSPSIKGKFCCQAIELENSKINITSCIYNENYCVTPAGMTPVDDFNLEL